MSTAEEALESQNATRRKAAPIGNRILDFVSSVRFGVVQLCVLVVLSMIGMLIVQQNVDGFDTYYFSLTPAERSVFGALGFFDIYHSWYFNLLLLTLSLNIVLASIDRFPSAWEYIVKPKVKATRDWLKERASNDLLEIDAPVEVAVQTVRESFEAHGLKVQTKEYSYTEYGVDEDGKRDFSVINRRSATVVFGESGKYNRLGAYIVHVFLLTLFLGHFVALQTGFDADVRMVPGSTTNEIQMIEYDLDKKQKFNVQIPFSLECTDIQQRLIDENGSIDVSNTLDWRTQMKIVDPDYGDMVADISMNKPLSYRGYRFFQAQTIPFGNARKITLEVSPESGGQSSRVDINRNGTTNLPDGTSVEFAEFMPDFVFGKDGKPDTQSGDYNKPVAVLNVITPGSSERQRVFAFAPGVAENIPVGAPKAGYKWRLADYEKSPLAHILSIKYDPYEAAFIAWYIGGFGLVFALMFVFFLSHKRVWAHVGPSEGGKTEIVLGGEANRNQLAFDDKFKKIVDDIKRK